MKEHPLPLMPDMVRAYYEDRKTQTRRVIQPQPDLVGSDGTPRRYKPIEIVLGNDIVVIHGPVDDPHGARYVGPPITCPYGQPGDRLWIRERLVRSGDHARYAYDGSPVLYNGEPAIWPWKVNKLISRYMPRWACRSVAEIVEVRAEQVQAITPRDVVAEGLYHEPGAWGEDSEYPHLVRAFSQLWDSINAARGYSWASNPWVWAITFKRLHV